MCAIGSRPMHRTPNGRSRPTGPSGTPGASIPPIMRITSVRSSFPITPAVLIEFITAHSPGEVRAADGTRSVDERLTHRRVKSARTLERYLASLRALHRLAGYKDDPTADVDVEAARRLAMRGRTRAKPKKPLRLAQVEEVLALPNRSRSAASVPEQYQQLLDGRLETSANSAAPPSPRRRSPRCSSARTRSAFWSRPATRSPTWAGSPRSC